MKRILIISAINVLFLFSFSMPSFSSSQCYGFKEAVSSYDLIFEGKAIKTGHLTAEARKEYSEKYDAGIRRSNILPDMYTEFEVVTLYKGPAEKTLKVFYRTLPLDNGNATFPIPRTSGDVSPPSYRLGNIVKIFAQQQNNLYIVHGGICEKKYYEDLKLLKQTYDALDDLIDRTKSPAEYYIKKADMQESYKDYSNALLTYKTLFARDKTSAGNVKYKIGYGRNLYYSRQYEEALNVLLPLKLEPEATTYTQLAWLRKGHVNKLAGEKLLMSGQEISDLTIQDANLPASDFHGAKLKNVKLIDVKMPGADFSNSHFEGEIRNSELAGVKFDDAKLWARFFDSNFDKASFKAAKVDLMEASNNSYKQADFTGGDISFLRCGAFQKDWLGSDFSSAHFNNATIGGLGKSKVANADFTGMKFFTNGCTSNQDLDLSRKNFDNTKFDFGDYSGGSFKNSSLKNASFAGANLSNVDFSGADLTGSNFTVSSYMGAVKIHGADFTDAKIDSVNWEGAIYDCNTKFPKGFDSFINKLEAADRGCSTPKGAGVIIYSRDRFRNDRINVCYGEFNAGCVYAFLINYTINGTHNGERFHYFKNVVQSLINAGQYEPAKLMLMRELAEFEQINGSGQPIIPELQTLLMNLAGHTVSEDNPMRRTNSADINQNPVFKHRKLVLEQLRLGNKANAREMAMEHITKVHQVQHSIGAYHQAEILLAYADILARTEKEINPEVFKELEPLIRYSQDVGDYKKHKNAPEIKDFVSQGEKIYAGISSIPR